MLAKNVLRKIVDSTFSQPRVLKECYKTQT